MRVWEWRGIDTDCPAMRDKCNNGPRPMRVEQQLPVRPFEKSIFLCDSFLHKYILDFIN